MCGKTGTVQNPRGKNHSVFIGFAPRDNPKIAIAVIVENAGYGSTYAAPIASYITEQYLKGTLPKNKLAEVEWMKKQVILPALPKPKVKPKVKADRLGRKHNYAHDPALQPANLKMTINKPIQYTNDQSAKHNRFFFNVDWVTILIYVALCAIGFVNIYASIYNPDESTAFNFTTNYGKQLIFIITGLVLGFSILLLDAKFFSIFSPIIYGVTMLLLMVVLVVGRNVGGNQAWISDWIVSAAALRTCQVWYGPAAGQVHQLLLILNSTTLKPILIAAADHHCCPCA